jgi:hypothetical protein
MYVFMYVEGLGQRLALAPRPYDLLCFPFRLALD